MNGLEFLGKLRMVYCGDKNAFDEISAEQERLSIIEEKHKDCTQYYVNGFKEEIDRLNNKVSELENINEKIGLALDSAENKVDRLNNIIDTMLKFSFFKEECPLNFGFGDEKEEKAQDVFYENDYCEENCNNIYKKCWLKYFEKLQDLKENNK